MVVTLSVPVAAQATSEPAPVAWMTKEECFRAPASTPTYVPFLHSKKHPESGIDKNKEIVLGLPADGCIEADFPDLLKGKYAKAAKGDPMVWEFDRKTGKVGKLLRMAKCNNDVYSFTPFPVAPPAKDGTNGLNGSSCSARSNGDGTSTVSCTNGTHAIIQDGKAGAGCSVVDNGDRSKTLTCGDYRVIVYDGKNAEPTPTTTTAVFAHDEEGSGKCGKAAWRCWVPPVGGGILAGFFLTRGHSNPSGLPPGAKIGTAF